MRKKRIEKLEDTLIQKNQSNIIVLWDGINKPFEYQNKKYENKEELEKEYPNIKFDYMVIVWEDGNIPIEKQTDKRVIETLKEFDENY